MRRLLLASLVAACALDGCNLTANPLAVSFFKFFTSVGTVLRTALRSAAGCAAATRVNAVTAVSWTA